MHKFESSYNKFAQPTMIDILCFDCGGMYQASYDTKDITKQCQKCQGIKDS